MLMWHACGMHVTCMWHACGMHVAYMWVYNKPSWADAATAAHSNCKEVSWLTEKLILVTIVNSTDLQQNQVNYL